MAMHVEAARQAILAQLRVLRSEQSVLEKALKALASDANATESLVAPVKVPSRRTSVIKPAIEAVLKSRPAGAYAHAREIQAELTASGIPLSDKDPTATVVTALIRMRAEGLVGSLGGNRWVWRGPREPQEAMP